MSRIIIADDDKTLQKIYQKIFEPLGHECRFFLNGRDAVDALRDEWADLVILDCNMPVMNGYEACRAIRSMPNAKDLPIIIVSADDSQENILKLLNAGANDYVLKPVREAVLATKLKNFLKTSSLSGEVLEFLHGKTEIADRYKIEKVLGYGAHSIVFLAGDLRNDGRRVALKMLNLGSLSDSLAEKIRLMAGELRDAGPFENVVNVFDVGTRDKQTFIVLEYADGGDLATLLKSKGRIQETEAVSIALDCALGIAELASKNLSHLDLKPENVLSSGGRFKLADFGVPMDDTTGTTAINSEIWSTVAYASPEIFLESESLSIKSDIYSLGVLVYEAMTGDNPFKADKMSASVFRHLNQKPTSLALAADQCCVELSNLVDEMLAKEASERPSPDELVSRLQHIQSEFGKGKASSLTYETPSAVSSRTSESAPPLKRDDAGKSRERHADAEGFEDGTPIPSPGRRKTRLESCFDNSFFKIAVALFIFAVVFAATHLVQSMMAASNDETELKGVMSVVICPKCGNIEVKPVADIRKTRCSKCGAREWFAAICSKCGKIFPVDEDKFDDSDLDDPDKLEEMEKCPYCGSEDIAPLNPKTFNK